MAHTGRSSFEINRLNLSRALKHLSYLAKGEVTVRLYSVDGVVYLAYMGQCAYVAPVGETDETIDVVISYYDITTFCDVMQDMTIEITEFGATLSAGDFTAKFTKAYGVIDFEFNADPKAYKPISPRTSKVLSEFTKLKTFNGMYAKDFPIRLNANTIEYVTPACIVHGTLDYTLQAVTTSCSSIDTLVHLAPTAWQYIEGSLLFTDGAYVAAVPVTPYVDDHLYAELTSRANMLCETILRDDVKKLSQLASYGSQTATIMTSPTTYQIIAGSAKMTIILGQLETKPTSTFSLPIKVLQNVLNILKNSAVVMSLAQTKGGRALWLKTNLGLDMILVVV